MNLNGQPVTYRDPETGEERKVGEVVTFRQLEGEYYQVVARITDPEMRERITQQRPFSFSMGSG